METTPLQKSVERGISRNPRTTQTLFWLTWCPIRASLPRFLFPFSPQSDGSRTLSPMLVPQVPNTCARNPVQEYLQRCSSEQPRTSKGGHLPPQAPRGMSIWWNTTSREDGCWHGHDRTNFTDRMCGEDQLEHQWLWPHPTVHHPQATSPRSERWDSNHPQAHVYRHGLAATCCFPIWGRATYTLSYQDFALSLCVFYWYNVSHPPKKAKNGSSEEFVDTEVRSASVRDRVGVGERRRGHQYEVSKRGPALHSRSCCFHSKGVMKRPICCLSQYLFPKYRDIHSRLPGPFWTQTECFLQHPISGSAGCWPWLAGGGYITMLIHGVSAPSPWYGYVCAYGPPWLAQLPCVKSARFFPKNNFSFTYIPKV